MQRVLLLLWDHNPNSLTPVLIPSPNPPLPIPPPTLKKTKARDENVSKMDVDGCRQCRPVENVSGRRRRRAVENVSLVDVDQLKTSVLLKTSVFLVYWAKARAKAK